MQTRGVIGIACALGLVSACYRSDAPSCTISCATDNDCPGQLTCSAAQLCTTGPACNPATIDAPMADMSTIDARTNLTLLSFPFETNLVNVGAAASAIPMLMGTGTVGFVPGKVGDASRYPAGTSASATGVRALLGGLAGVTLSFWYNQPNNLSGVNFAVNLANRTTAPYGGISVGFSGGNLTVCVATTTNPAIPNGSACQTMSAGTANQWHHFAARYAGTGTAAGQGGDTEIFVDGVEVTTIANDANKNPVFSASIPDTITVGTGATNVSIDELRIYDRVFTPMEQCTTVVGGVWNAGSSTCTLP